MTYLILGSNSFAGSSLVNYLLSGGNHVLGVSRSPQPHPVMQPYMNHPNKQAFTFFQYDLNEHHSEVIQLIQKYKPKFIIDLAGQGMVAESWSNPEQWYLTNIVSKVKLHEFLRGCDFIERYVRVSTPEVYGSTHTKVKEDHAYHPSTPYAVSHAAVDMSLMAYYKQYQFPVVLTRFANFYGPHQQLFRIVPRTIIYALTHQKLQLHGGGHARRAFIHAYDVATAIDAVIKKGVVGETYHFSTDVNISIRDLVEKICQLMKVDMSSLATISEDRPGKDANYDMDTAKANKELQWKPAHTLEDGLNQTIDWIKSNIESIKQLPLNYIHKP